MTGPDWDHTPHRRLNILTGERVLVSPQRTRRPWRGGVENSCDSPLPDYDPDCYLCPGNRRAGGARNPEYTGTFAFDNDFPALVPGVSVAKPDEAGLLLRMPEPGLCRVICFSPRHDLTLARMEARNIRKVVDVWTDEYRTIGERDEINYVQIFENKGELMGCSNPHPHGQIWAQQSIPGEPSKELLRMLAHFEITGRPLLLDYLALELDREERIVCGNDGFVVVVPFWAVWPFEVMVLPRRPIASLVEMTDAEKIHLASIVGRLTKRYDRLFGVSFAYSSGIHQAPTDDRDHPHCTLHMHFYPPLLRSATVKKFMVGYEMLAEAQRDVTPEKSAALLRDLPDE